MAKRVYCLYRVSTTRQVDRNERNEADIPMQRKACREFAREKGWQIVGEESETGVSGFKVRATERDKIQLIKAHAEQGRFDILLVFMFDRIGRRAEETPFVVEWLAEQGIEVWSVTEGEQRFDSHADYLMNYIRYWQASGESKKTAIRTRTAMEQMIVEGRFRGGNAPYGYRLEKSGILNKRKHEVYKLVINEDEAPVVRLIFETYLCYGYGRTRMARFLNEKGIKNRSGKNWHESSIAAMLHNALYKGVMKNGSTYSEPLPELMIIDTQTFDFTQKLLSERSSASENARTLPLNTTGKSLLSGNVFCGHCGGRLTLTTSGKVVTLASGEHKGVKRVRYICYNKTRRRTDCDGQTGYTMHLLDETVSEAILHLSKMLTATAGNEPVDEGLNHLLTAIRIFDVGNQELKKMIAAYLLKRVEVYRGYQIKVEYTPVVRHYLTGTHELARKEEIIQAVFSKLSAVVIDN